MWYAWKTGTGLLKGEYRTRPTVPPVDGADPKTVVEFQTRDELRAARKQAGETLDTTLEGLLDSEIPKAAPKTAETVVKIKVQHPTFCTETETKYRKAEQPLTPADAVFWFVQKAFDLFKRPSKPRSYR